MFLHLSIEDDGPDEVADADLQAETAEDARRADRAERGEE